MAQLIDQELEGERVQGGAQGDLERGMCLGL